MADVKITELPAAATAGDTDVLAGVQGGVTKKFGLGVVLAWLKTRFTAADVGAQPTITINGILKGEGQGVVSAATPGTDYATPAQLDDKADQSELATEETGTTASRGYLPGERFVWNGILYRAKTAISSGATFTPGTNCEATTVAAELGIPVEYAIPTTAKFTGLTGAAYRSGNVVTFVFRGVASEAMASSTELLRFPNASPSTNGQVIVITRGYSVYTGRVNSGTFSSVPTARLYSNTAISAADNISIFGMYFL